MASLTEVKAASSVGWAEDIGQRDEMEDCFIFVDAFGGRTHDAFFGIYDGHGGRQCADYVMKHLHECVLAELPEALQSGGMHNGDAASCISSAIAAAFRGTDDKLLQSGITTSGCTACTCLVHEDRSSGRRTLFTAHLGDARAVLCRDGNAERLTSLSDHKATDGQEMLRVQRAGGFIMNERVNAMLAIVRAFGNHQLKAPNTPQNIVSNEPDITCIELSNLDSFVIVACDGLWDVIDDDQAVRIAMECVRVWTHLAHPPRGQEDVFNRRRMAAVCARCLVEEALARGSSDNVSCLVYFPH